MLNMAFLATAQPSPNPNTSTFQERLKGTGTLMAHQVPKVIPEGQWAMVGYFLGDPTYIGIVCSAQGSFMMPQFVILVSVQASEAKFGFHIIFLSFETLIRAFILWGGEEVIEFQIDDYYSLWMDDLGAFHHIFPTMLFAFPSTPCWDNFTSCSQDTTVATNSPLFNSRVSKQGHGKGHSEPRWLTDTDIWRV